MKYTSLIILFFNFCVIGQVGDSCFQYIDPFSYGVGEQISFTDTTFRYEYIQGLINGSVKGEYSLSGDTITINSEFQEDDYQLTQTFNTSIARNSINLEITSIEYGHDFDVRYREDKHHVTLYPGKIISHSRNTALDEISDTVIQLFEIPISDEMQEIEVSIWRTNSTIVIPITEHFNSYTLDLTPYPNALDYIFFKDQKLVLRGNYLFFLTEENEPEKGYYNIKSRKGIKVSKRKKVKKWVKCT